MFNRLYLHIPFCHSKCPYCAFVSRQANAPEIDAYVELMMEEMRLAQETSVPHLPLDSIYLGGGTPSLLQPQQVSQLLEHAANLFGVSEKAEITLEANPGTVDYQRLAGFRSAGVNRLSLGVQSFDNRMLASLGRIHTAGQAQDAVSAARQAGFDNIGIDLIHALPGQTLEMWSNDLERALRLAPDHLSIYGLTVEEGTPFAERYSDKDTLLPDEDLSADMFETADTLLTVGGFEHYEIANYARPGCRARHNSGYWKRDGYLGLGAGAHSFLRSGEYGIRFSNTSDLDEYGTSIRNKCVQRHDPMVLTRVDAQAEFMFLGLRMADGILFSNFAQEFNISMEAVFPSQLNNLKALELLEISTHGVRLTRRGILLSNYVFAQFLA